MKLTAATILLLSILSPAAAAADSPNIVLLLADDQGWTGTSVQMDERVRNSRSDLYRTPNLERLAAQGMRFSNAYSLAPNCSPTRMSIQTGKTHVWEGGIRVPLVIRGPGIAEGTQSHVPAIGYDFLPTIAEWVGASEDLPADIDGGSLAGVLAGDGTGTVERGTDALIWYYGAYRNMKHVGPQAAIRRNNHKLIRSPWVDFSSLRWCMPETPSARTHESLDHSEQAVDSTELGAAKPRMDYQAQ